MSCSSSFNEERTILAGPFCEPNVRFCLARKFFWYFARPPPPHNFSNGPSPSLKVMKGQSFHDSHDMNVLVGRG